MTCDKPMLTGRGAFEQFPDECVMLFNDYWKLPRKLQFWVDWVSHCADEYITMRLMACALRWLAGRGVDPDAALDVADPWDDDQNEPYIWPDDPLRMLLEEVREQRKKENQNDPKTEKCPDQAEGRA